MDWYKEWFDTPYYDVLYAHRDDNEAKQLAHFIASRCPVAQFPSVLDVCCGRGRHTINFAQLGYQVTGVDLSERALRVANERIQHLQLAQAVTLYKHEVRELYELALPKHDLVVNLFTSFGYFDEDTENLKVLEQMTQYVQQKGCLILDYFNPAYITKRFISEEKKVLNGHVMHIERTIVNDSIQKTIIIDNTREFTERVKLYNLEWFSTALARYGMTINSVAGTYQGDVFDTINSPRMVIFAHY